MNEHETVSELTVERYVLRELPPDQQAAMLARLTHDTELQTRVARLVENNAAVLRAYPPDREAAAIKARLHASPKVRPQRPRWPQISAVCGALAMAAVLIWLVPFLRAPAPPDLIGDRLKGDASVMTVERVDGEGHARPLKNNATVEAGDVLRIQLSNTSGYFVVIALDGAGGITLIYPDSASAQAGKRSPSDAATLPLTYTLDAAPSFERLIWVRAPRPFAADTVLQAARALTDRGPDVAASAPLSLPTDLQQGDLLLHR